MNAQLRRAISALLLLIIGTAFWIFGNVVGFAGGAICDGGWKLNAGFWTIFGLFGTPGLLLIIGHAAQIASPSIKSDRKFWISSILYNFFLFIPPVLIIASDPSVIGGAFDTWMFFIAAFPLAGIILSIFALKLP